MHDADLLAAHSLDGLMAIYGYDPATSAEFAQHIVDDFHYTASARRHRLR